MAHELRELKKQNLHFSQKLKKEKKQRNERTHSRVGADVEQICGCEQTVDTLIGPRDGALDGWC